MNKKKKYQQEHFLTLTLNLKTQLPVLSYLGEKKSTTLFNIYVRIACGQNAENYNHKKLV